MGTLQKAVPAVSTEDEVLVFMNVNRVDIPEKALADFCLRNHIRRLALFGSILREDFGPESDIDVLVEFEPGTRVGLRSSRFGRYSRTSRSRVVVASTQRTQRRMCRLGQRRTSRLI